MKEETRDYLIAGFFLAIVVFLLVAALYLEWHTLLYFVALSLMVYGAYRLLEQSKVGQKMLELLIGGPVILFFATITLISIVYPLGALLRWWPWLYVNGQPIYGTAILEDLGGAVLVVGFEAFGVFITVCFIAGVKSVWHREHLG